MLDEKLQAAVQAAYQAGKLLRERFGSTFRIREKSPANLVTELDLQSEQLIVSHLTKVFPDIATLTEEAAYLATDSAIERWIIDPLDGTTNYAHGYPCFAVSIALEQYGHTVLGVVYDPTLDHIYTAVRDSGALRNGIPIQVSNTSNLKESLVGSGFPYDAWTNEHNNTREWQTIIKTVASARCDGAAALDLCRVACGSLDGFWELDLESWDMAAGALVIREAGGLVTLANGKPFTPYQRSILASNRTIHAEMLEVLRGSTTAQQN